MRTSNFPSLNKTTTVYSGTYLTVNVHEFLLNITWTHATYVGVGATGTPASTITITNIDNTTTELKLITNFITGAGNTVIKKLQIPLNYKSIAVTQVTAPGVA
jgi:uncharacterized membrane protein